MRVCLECSSTFKSENGWQCPTCEETPEAVEGFPFFAPELAKENDGFPDDFEKLWKFEDNNFWFRARNELIVWAIQKFFGSARSFLEVGCGTGYVLTGIHKAFPSLKLCGSEIYYNGLRFARTRLPGVTLIQMDARQIPFSDEFDLIGSFDVLEHVDQDETVLKQMAKAVRKKNGGLILTVPQHKALWSYIDEYSFHVRRYSETELKEKIARAGFEVLYTTSFVSLLLPLMLIQRLSRGDNSKNFDPQAEMKIPPLINKSFEMVMSAERSLIQAGMPLPVGGSLLLVARIRS